MDVKGNMLRSPRVRRSKFIQLMNRLLPFAAEFREATTAGLQ